MKDDSMDLWEVVWVPPPGMSLIDAIDRIKRLSNATNTSIRLMFNGTEVVVQPGANIVQDIEQVTREWWAKRKREQLR